MNIMLDIETMGVSFDSAILSIGAVAFDTELREEFYTTVDLSSSMNLGLKVDASTINWWLNQSDQARSAITKANAETLPDALLKFARFLAEYQTVLVWGNGATFDNVVLSNAYAACKIPRPWSYRNDRCYRTLASLTPDVTKHKPDIPHHALYDAKAQAIHCLDLLRNNK